jgi:IclR family pca regulon transcriptional regulator
VAPESFSAVVLDAHEVVIVARAGSDRSLFTTVSGRVTAYGLHMGARLPAHATSTGRVLLAAKSRSDFTTWMKGRTLQRMTPLTTVEPRAFRARVEQVRRDDYCLACEEHELGVYALAVPLRNASGTTVAALNAVATHGRITSAASIQKELLPLLQDTARELRPLL